MKVCLRLRHLIRECIPCELEESAITRSHSTVITKNVVQAAKEAGGQKYRACVVSETCPVVHLKSFTDSISSGICSAG